MSICRQTAGKRAMKSFEEALKIHADKFRPEITRDCLFRFTSMCMTTDPKSAYLFGQMLGCRFGGDPKNTIEKLDDAR